MNRISNSALAALVTVVVAIPAAHPQPAQVPQPAPTPATAPDERVQGRVIDSLSGKPLQGAQVSIVNPRPSAEADPKCSPATTRGDGRFEIKTSNCIKNFMLQVTDSNKESRFWPLYYSPLSFSPYPLELPDIKVAPTTAELADEGLRDVIQIETNLSQSNPEVAASIDSALSKMEGPQLAIRYDPNGGPRYTLRLQDSSRYEIRSVYLSPSKSSAWAGDLLGDKTLKSSKSFDITNISPGVYDLKLVFEDGGSCVVRSADFSQNTTLNITDNSLLGCLSH